jgi:glutathione synthase/RimK-type ligase-like ATP-grasp enzyme
MNRQIAFATQHTQPKITADDVLAAAALAKFGIDVIGVPWDEAGIDWAGFEAVVLRSCWNYIHHPREFVSWIEMLERKGVWLVNDFQTVRWNMEKTYLKDLVDACVEVVPTVYTPQGSGISIGEVLKQYGWARAVIKPTISGTALHTWVSSTGSLKEDQRQLDTLLGKRSMMLQKYLPEVETDGEWSLIYFHGQYSHAVIKVPREGDFRVQKDFGGSEQPMNPELSIRRRAEEILRVRGRDSVYARVDGVMHERRFLLMELELIEPVLFLGSNPGAAERFAVAIEKNVQARMANEE